MTTLTTGISRLTLCEQVRTLLHRLTGASRASSQTNGKLLSLRSKANDTHKRSTTAHSSPGPLWSNQRNLLGFEPNELILLCLLQQSHQSGAALARWKAGGGDQVFELEVRNLGIPHWTLKSTHLGQVKVLWSRKEANLQNVLHQLAFAGTLQFG